MTYIQKEGTWQLESFEIVIIDQQYKLIEYAKRCKDYQEFNNPNHATPDKLHSIFSPWPFSLLSIDILGPFPIEKG